MAIAYQTGVECIGKLHGYFVFHNYIMNTFGVVKDNDQDTIIPPHCAYCSLETILRFKDIPQDKIRRFIADVKLSDITGV